MRRIIGSVLVAISLVIMSVAAGCKVNETGKASSAGSASGAGSMSGAVSTGIILRVGDIDVTSDPGTWSGEGNTGDKGKWSYSPASGETPDTLTLNGFNYEGKGSSGPESGGIIYDGTKPLVIKLEGKSSIKCTGESLEKGYGLWAVDTGEITICGDGDLRLEGCGSKESAGIYADKCRLNIKDTTVEAGGGAGEKSYGILSDIAYITGSNVTATAGDFKSEGYGIGGRRLSVTEKSSLTATGGSSDSGAPSPRSSGIHISLATDMTETEYGDTFVIADSTIKAVGGDIRAERGGSYGISCYNCSKDERKSNAAMIVESGRIEAMGGKASGGDVVSHGIYASSVQRKDKSIISRGDGMVIGRGLTGLLVSGYTSAYAEMADDSVGVGPTARVTTSGEGLTLKATGYPDAEGTKGGTSFTVTNNPEDLTAYKKVEVRQQI